LSNNGEPMRRFMQTFVLVPQNPKKFYVHNDIFRYQDEVYNDNSDSECEGESLHSQSLPEQPHQHKPIQRDVNVDEYYQQEATQQQKPVESVGSLLSSSRDVVQQQQHDDVLTTHCNEVEANVVVNGHALDAVDDEQVIVDEVENEQLQKQHLIDEVVQQQQQEEVMLKEEVQQKPVQQQSQPTEPQIKSSWARIVNNPLTAPVAAPTRPNNVQTVVKEPQVKKQAQQNENSDLTFGTNTPRSANTEKQSQKPQQQRTFENKRTPDDNIRQLPQREQRNQNQQVPQQQQQQQPSQQQQQPSQQTAPASAEANVVTNDDADKKFSRYPDAHQIFVGNLQPEMSEQELKNFFGQYGSVVEVRINSNSKQQSGRRLPNYGFVVFENKESVENLLHSNSNKSNNLSYKNEKGIEYRLNIEEKRARQGGHQNGGGMNGGHHPNKVRGAHANRSSSNGSKNRDSNGGYRGGNSNKRGLAQSNSTNTATNTRRS
jgi:Ras GTPase-activating protein-binding protein 1